MTTEPGIASRATSPGIRSGRRWLKVALALIAVTAIAMLFTVGVSGTSGGLAYPWDYVLPDIRSWLRESWASFTGQSIHQDLLP